MTQTELLKLYDFTGQTFVVTGGTGILCSEMVKALVSCGANVAVLARSEEKGAALLAELNAPDRAIIVPGDVLQPDTLKAAAEKVIEKFGRIDGLLNGAGGNSPKATAIPPSTFFDLPEEAIRYVFDLNLYGTLLPTQIFGRYIAEQKAGVILNISSMSALRPLTRVVSYSAAKGAIDNFTKWLAVHLAQEFSPDIRVNAVAPGFFITEQNRSLLTNIETGEPTARGNSIITHTPMGRFGNPEDLLGATLWLLSPASKFVTGIVVPVDGGFSAFAGV